MGDRANIIITQYENEPPVVIYSHWGGTSIINSEVVADAMDHARTRVGDPHYFTALFVEHLTKVGLISGIGTSMDDNEHPVTVINSMTGDRTMVTEAMARSVISDGLVVV